MNSSHYSQPKSFRIYALVLPDEEIVYIGKTAGKRLSAVFSSHICGKIAATKPYCSKLPDQYPNLHLLETIYVSTSDAYRHVLCWIHRFELENYQVINHEKSLTQAHSLLPETKEILKAMPAEDLDTILQRTKLEHPAAADTKTEPDPKAAPCKISHLSIRLPEKEKKNFDQLAKKLHCNQQETVRYLLNLAVNEHHLINRESHHISKELRTLQKENSGLHKQLLQLQEQTAPEFRQIESLREQYSMIQKGVLSYVQSLTPMPPVATPLPTSSYKKYMRALPPGISYPYPEEEGFLTFFPEALLYGHKPAVFLVGHDTNGNRYKLRIYPKNTHIGFSLKSIYGVIDSCWYLGFRRSGDGAMDLTLSLPILSNMYLGTDKCTYPKKPSLDDQIAAALLRG